MSIVASMSETHGALFTASYKTVISLYFILANLET